MTPDDVRWLAQKVVAKAFHGVTDASVEALARRVLELEADAEEHADNVRAVEREACAELYWEMADRGDCIDDIFAAIRARGVK